MRKAFRYVTYKQFSAEDLELTSKVYVPPKKVVDRTRKGDDEHSIHNAIVSVQHAHKSLYDLLRANEWKYFITLTFGEDERASDQWCRDQFSKWRKIMRNDFPDMYYVAVPEYHERGSIHYHVVVGGVSSDQLGLVDSGRVLHYGKAWLKEDFFSKGFKVDESTGEGATIFNVAKWSLGFSTATEIRSSGAVSHYVSKYLTKNNIDPRFFNKRRFYASHNCNRAKVVKDIVPTYIGCSDHVLDLGVEVNFRNPKFNYTKYDCPEDIIRARLAGLEPMPTHLLPFDSTSSE